MTLATFSAEIRARLFEALEQGHSPPEGAFDDALFKEAREKGKPQLGSVRNEPDAVHFEYIYPVAGAAPIVLTVRVAPPERIVFMPVPSWVVESVWEGEVSGSYHFESEAKELLAEFARRLEPGANAQEFEARQAIGRH